jgi:phage-related protein
MPKIQVVFWCDEKGTAPFLGWFSELTPKAQDKCLVRIERLKELGHELRRPEADNLGDGIYELRLKHQQVNYRILYFFHGRQLVVLTHGFAKQQAAIPLVELKTAVDRKNKFIGSPNRHTYTEK